LVRQLWIHSFSFLFPSHFVFFIVCAGLWALQCLSLWGKCTKSVSNICNSRIERKKKKGSYISLFLLSTFKQSLRRRRRNELKK
jgi:hypothetical protein